MWVWVWVELWVLAGVPVLLPRDLNDADILVFCNASLQGLAFWYPECSAAFYAPVPSDTAHNINFYFEALAVASACNNLSNMMEDCSKIIIYTDRKNTVDIFNSLHCQPEFNPLLHYCVDIILKKDFYIQVLHLPCE
jgi:hypothetical protein